MPSALLILGAAGRIGQTLSRAFAAAGWAVRAQSRKPLPPDLASHPQVQWIRCDALDVDALRTAAEGAQVVVHALNPPYTQWDRLALPLADAAIAAARHSGALLMLPGNVYNYGKDLPAHLAPATPESGDNPKARIRIETEARLAASPGLASVVIRAGDFFGGGGRGSWFDQGLTSRLAKGRFIYPGNVDIPHAWAYLPDLAQAFVRVAERHASLSGHHRLHFRGHTATGRELHQAFEVAMGRPLRPQGLPWPLIRLAALAVPMCREMVTMRYLWQRPHQLVDDGTMRQWTGSLQATPLPEAVRTALAELGFGNRQDVGASASLSHSARA